MSQATTVREHAGELERRHLLAIVDGRVTTHALPESGAVVIGREADLAIEHPSISRRHARLVVGRALTIEDLGSANGTRLRDRRLAPGQPAAIEPGEALELGAAIVIVQAGLARHRSHRLWAHGYFEARLEDECARADDAGAELALIRVSCGTRHPAALVEERLAAALRDRDVVGLYAPGEYEVLCPDTAPAEAHAIAGAITDELRRLGAAVRCGVACRPRDQRGPHALFAAACMGVRPPPAADVRASAPIVAAPAMRRLYQLVARIAASDVTVLVRGETGAGKELIAEALHRASPRARGPLVRVNAGAIAESLIDSELFGHERGAFTGALQARVGLIESADGGTLFLDEVAELPAATQARLLRVLEDRLVTRVGSTRPRAVSVRFVAATHRDLEAEVARGAFRQDLFYRLGGVTVFVPPLRERGEEIEPLARAFAREAAERLGRTAPVLAPEAQALLERHPWPGNVRELRNAMERAVLLADRRIEREHLPLEKLTTPTVTAAPAPATLPAQPAPPSPAGAELRRELDDVERQHIVEALARCGGNQTEAARLLGISRRTLSTKLDKLAITRPRKK